MANMIDYSCMWGGFICNCSIIMYSVWASPTLGTTFSMSNAVKPLDSAAKDDDAHTFHQCNDLGSAKGSKLDSKWPPTVSRICVC